LFNPPSGFLREQDAQLATHGFVERTVTTRTASSNPALHFGNKAVDQTEKAASRRAVSGSAKVS
jgi:hypothetical protein